MTPLRLSQLINDPRGPGMILPTLAVQELRTLIYALYWNLDTPSPTLQAETCYQLAVAEDRRRSPLP